MDILEFKASLKDMMSSGFQNIGNAAQSTFGKIDRGLQGLQGKISGLGKGRTPINIDTSGIDAAGRKVDDFGKKLDNLGDKGGGFGMGKAAMLGDLGASAIKETGRMAMELGKNALELGMETERGIIGLGTFVGDDKAKGIYEQIQGQAVNTPFTTKDFLPIEMGLVSAGQAPERANKDMMNLANAVASTGGNDFMLSLMGSHLAQAASSGKIDGLLLREFQRTAHIPIEAMVAADMFPKLNKQEGIKKVRGMDELTYDQLTHALQRASEAGGMFAGGMERLSQTMSGKWSTIKDFWQIGLSKLTMSQMDNIKKIEDQMIGGLTRFPEMIAGWAPTVDKLFGKFNDMLPSLESFGNGLLDLLKPLGGLIMSDTSTKMLKDGLEVVGNLFKGLETPMQIFTGAIEKLDEYLLGPFLNTLNKITAQRHEKLVEMNIPAYVLKGNVDSMAKEGYSVDTVRLRKMENNLGRYFKSTNAIDSFNQKNPEEWIGSFKEKQIPFMYSGDVKKETKAANSAAQETSDAIVGGGRKITNFNFNAPLVKIGDQHFAGTKEMVKDFQERLEEGIARILAGVPA